MEYELNAAFVKQIILVRKWYIFIQERRKKFTNNDKLWFRSVPQNTNTSVDIGNLRNGTERE